MFIPPVKAAGAPALSPASAGKTGGQAQRPGFADHLKATLKTANILQHRSATAQEELSTGRNGNIHETLIAMNKADISFRMLTEVRNKLVNAYQEVMRMQA